MILGRGMKQLIMVRHGESDLGSQELNSRGREQIQSLALHLRGLRPLVLSSMGPRSIESATILARELGSMVVSNEFFGSSRREDQANYYLSAVTFLEQETAQDDTVIIVTKGEYITDFIPFFGDRYLGVIFPISELQHGKAVMIDCVSRTISEISSVDLF